MLSGSIRNIPDTFVSRCGEHLWFKLIIYRRVYCFFIVHGTLYIASYPILHRDWCYEKKLLRIVLVVDCIDSIDYHLFCFALLFQLHSKTIPYWCMLQLLVSFNNTSVVVDVIDWRRCCSLLRICNRRWWYRYMPFSFGAESNRMSPIPSHLFFYVSLIVALIRFLRCLFKYIVDLLPHIGQYDVGSK